MNWKHISMCSALVLLVPVKLLSLYQWVSRGRAAWSLRRLAQLSLTGLKRHSSSCKGILICICSGSYYDTFRCSCSSNMHSINANTHLIMQVHLHPRSVLWHLFTRACLRSEHRKKWLTGSCLDPQFFRKKNAHNLFTLYCQHVMSCTVFLAQLCNLM